MPSAIPDGATLGLPPARMIDPRGHRFGAGVSAVILAVAIASQQPWLVLLVALSIGMSAALGMRYSVYGMVWRRLVRIAGLGAVEPEHEYPPRFAQVLGTTALTIGLLAFAAGVPAVGWLMAVGVAALQTLLAATGYCLGCRLYVLRWWVPELVTRIWTRDVPRQPAFVAEKIEYR
jgi:hypothetical protein